MFRSTWQSDQRNGEFTVFVGGPITSLVQKQDFLPDLRHSFENLFQLLREAGFVVCSAHEVERFGEVDVVGQDDIITTRDLNWMQHCDCFVALIPPGGDRYPQRTDGTFVELGWASALRRPVVMVSDSQQLHSPCVKGLSTVTELEWLEYRDFLHMPSLVVDAVIIALKKSVVMYEK